MNLNTAASIGIGIGTETALADVARLREGLSLLRADIVALATATKSADLGAGLKSGLQGSAVALKDEARKAATGVAEELSASKGGVVGSNYGNAIRKEVKRSADQMEGDVAQAAKRVSASFSQKVDGGTITYKVKLDQAALTGSELSKRATAFEANPGAAISAAKVAEDEAALRKVALTQIAAINEDEKRIRTLGVTQVRALAEDEKLARIGGVTQYRALADNEARDRRYGITQAVALNEEERRTRALGVAQARALAEEEKLARGAGVIQYRALADNETRDRRYGITQAAALNEEERRTRTLGVAQARALGEDEKLARAAGVTQYRALADNETRDRRYGITQVQALNEDEKRVRAIGLAQARAALDNEKILQKEREALAARASQNVRFQQAPLATRVNVLQQAQAVQSTPGADTSKFTPEILSQISTLPQLEAQLKALGAAHENSAAKTKLHTAEMAAGRNAMNDLHSSARGLAGSLGVLWTTWGSVVPIVAAAAIGGALASVFKQGKDVEYQLAFVRGMSEEVVKLNDLLKVTQGSQFTPKEGAEGLRALTQAGLSTHDALAALPDVLNLAQLGEMSVGAAALTASGAIHAFNLQTSDIGHVGDVFAKAAAVSNTSVQGIAESMKQASTVADFYHISIEQTAASLAVLAKRNIDGTQAGTALRNALKELVTPSEKAKEAMKQLNVNAFNGKELKDYTQLLDEFQKKTAGLNEKSRLNFLNDVFGERGAKAINAILSDYALYKKTLDDVSASAGFLTRAQVELADTAEGAFKRASGALSGSFVKAFEQASPAVQNFFDNLTRIFSSQGFQSELENIVRGVANISSAVSNNIGVITLAVAGYAAARLGLALLTAATTSVASAQAMWTTRTAASTTETTANTGAVAINTVELLGNSAAQKGNAVASIRNAEAASGLLTVASGVLRVFGLLGVAISVLYPLYEILAARTTDAARAQELHTSGIDHAINMIDAETAAIDRQIRSIRERNGEQKGVDQNTALGKLHESEDVVSKAQARITQIDDQRKKPGLTVGDEFGSTERTDLDLMKQRSDAEKLITEENRKQVELKTKLILLDGKQEQGRDVAARDKIGTGAADLLIQAKGKEKSLPAGTFEEIKRISEGAKDTKQDVDALQKALQTVQDTVRKAGGNYEGKDRAGITQANDEYKTRIQEIKEEYETTKRIIDLQRSSEVSRVKEQFKAGLITPEQEEKQINTVWEAAKAALAQAGGAALQEMQTLGRGDKQYLEFLDQAREEFHQKQQRRMEAEQEKQQRITNALQAQIALEKQKAAFGGQLAKVGSEETRHLDDNDQKFATRFMSDADKAVVEAQLHVNDRYGKLLDEINGKIAQQKELRPGLNEATDAGVIALKAEIDALEKARGAVLALAEARTRELEAKKLSFGAGVEEAFAKFSRSAEDHSKLAESFVTGSLSKMEDAFTTFVKTGKLDFKSLVTSIIDDFIQMQAKLIFRDFMKSGIDKAGGPSGIAGAVAGIGKASITGSGTSGDGGIINAVSKLWGGGGTYAFGKDAGAAATGSMDRDGSGSIFNGLSDSVTKATTDITAMSGQVATTGAGLGDLTTTGVNGLISSSTSLIAKQIFGTTSEMTATTALQGLAVAATNAGIALGGTAASSGGSGVLGGVLKLFGGSTGGQGATGTGISAATAADVGAAGGTLTFLHSGGIVGSEATFSRSVSPSVFGGAPRFHSGGIAGDEVPIIAQRGEGVFTPGQMAQLAPVGKGGVGGGGTIVNVSSTVIVEKNGDVKSDTKSSDADMGKQLSGLINTTIQQWVTREQRPGGQLENSRA